MPGYRIRWLQRFGIFKPRQHELKAVWVHAVSVGEVIAAIPLVKALLTRGDIHVMITTMTPTGSDRVLAAFGTQVEHVYAPYDLPWTTPAFLKRFQPQAIIIMETELWPNMITACAKRQLPLILANARLSERSAKKYARFAKTTHSIFNMLTHVAAQSQNDAARYIRLGLPKAKVSVTGNIKFDLDLSDTLRLEAAHLKKAYSLNGARRVWIAASTHDDEERRILDTFKTLLKNHPNLLLIIVPRHPERFEEVYELSTTDFKTARRSTYETPSKDVQVLLGDTMGEMLLLYGASDMAFIGGSLIPRGGHNMIEAAAWGLPIICGPHTFNFEDIAQRLEQYGGMQTVENERALEIRMQHWLSDHHAPRQTGKQALAFAEDNRGGMEKLLTILEDHI